MIRKTIGVVSCTILLGLAACSDDKKDKPKTNEPSRNTSTSVEVSASAGTVAGIQDGTTRKFLGIPYAMPPVGELRFAPPQAVASWSDTLDASASGPSCIQSQGALSAPGPQSEDCLTVNVYTPEGAEPGSLPVMTFIHGGAFVAGGSVQYDGSKLSEDYNVIVVTLNYRLGALGFVSHPDLDLELGSPLSGNMGLQDQQLALQWVQDNISEFGGDPENVTLFGESAGAMSTCVHLVAPGSQELADQFIMQSGVCAGGLTISSKAEMETLSSALVDNFCADAADKLECIRSQPAEEVIAWGADNGIFGAGWSPTIIPGSTVLVDDPIALIASGQYNQGPMILGTNQFEWGLFQAVSSAESVSSVEEFNAYIDSGYPETIAPTLKVAYAPPSDELANAFLLTMVTDQTFRCPTRRLARLAQISGSNVWLYSFDDSPEQENPSHAYELPYVFNYVSAALGIDPMGKSLLASFQGYWTSFAKNGAPAADGLVAWENYDASGDQHLSITDTPAMGAGLSASACDMWDAFSE